MIMNVWYGAAAWLKLLFPADRKLLYDVFIDADNSSGRSVLSSYMVSARTLTQHGEREDRQRTLHRGLDLSSLLTTRASNNTYIWNMTSIHIHSYSSIYIHMYSLLMNIHDVMALNTDLVVATHFGVLDCSADGIVDSGRDEKGEEARVEVLRRGAKTPRRQY
jgi:hypothetical protein